MNSNRRLTEKERLIIRIRGDVRSIEDFTNGNMMYCSVDELKEIRDLLANSFGRIAEINGDICYGR